MATKTKSAAKTDITKAYQVKWTTADGVTHYGVNRQAYGNSASDKTVKAHNAAGNLVVDDAILPIAHIVPIKDATECVSDGIDGEYYTYVDNAIIEATEKSDSLKGTIVPGKLFQIGVADGSAHYIITKVGTKTADVEWRGFSLDRYVDQRLGYGRKGVPLRDLLPYVGRNDGIRDLFAVKEQKRAQFLASLKVGQIIHYRENNAAAFARCEVVEVTEDQAEVDLNARRDAKRSRSAGKVKRFKVLALVGAWSTSEILRYMIDGTLYGGAWTTHIEKGDAINLNSDSIYESPDYTPPTWKEAGQYTNNPGLDVKTFDPTTAAPIPPPPAPTPEQAEQFRLWTAVHEAQKALNPPRHDDFEERIKAKRQGIELPPPPPPKNDLNTVAGATAEALERLLSAYHILYKSLGITAKPE